MSHATQTAGQRDMVLTRRFDAPVELVWKAWTDPSHVRQWWGPLGFTSPLAKMDIRVGGASLVCTRAPQEYGGFDMYNTWTYQRIEPLKRLEFVLNFADQDGNKLDPATMGLPPGIPKDVPHVVTFKALGDTQTEITVTESGYTSDEAVETSRAGLEQCLDKMAASFARASLSP